LQEEWQRLGPNQAARSLRLMAVTSGTAPPIHMPFCFEAAISSRMRSLATSRSNCAKALG
jgi:hypothetical protein